MQEEGRRIAGKAATLRGWIDHPVRGGRQDVVGQPLQHVADIDHQGPRGRSDVQPLPVRVLQLQTGLLGPQQQGDDVDVLVGTRAHPRCIGRHGRIVEHSQHAVSQLDLVLKEVVADPQMAGDGLQDPATQGVQRLEHGIDVVAEAGDFGRPQVVAHVPAIRMALGQFAAGVPELLQVDGGGTLGGLHSEGGQAARPARARLVVGALDLLGQGEEGPGVVDGAPDHPVVQTMVGDDGEAVSLEGCAQVVAEALEVGVETRHGHGDDSPGGLGRRGDGVEGGGHGWAS